MKKIFISEAAVTSNTQVITKKNDVVEFIAVLQEADAPNRNGRIYPKSALERALRAPQILERLNAKNFFVEAGHPPSDASLARQVTIQPTNIAAIVKELWWEGNLLKGRLETANTAIGRDMKGLIEQGSKVAFSLRAQAGVHRDPISGKTMVQDPINIITYDWVVNPSHEKAYLETIAEETKNMLFHRSGFQTLMESTEAYEQGYVIEEEKEVVMEEVNLLPHSRKKFKTLDQIYFHDANDKVKFENGIAIVETADGTKRIRTTQNDYILKDIRSKIREL